MERIDMHRLQELVRLHRMGLEPRQVARHLKMSPNTERRYRDILGPLSLLQGDENDLPPLDELRALVLAATPQLDLPQHNSSVARWRCDVEKMLSDGANPTAIFDRLRVASPIARIRVISCASQSGDGHRIGGSAHALLATQ